MIFLNVQVSHLISQCSMIFSYWNQKLKKVTLVKTLESLSKVETLFLLMTMSWTRRGLKELLFHQCVMQHCPFIVQRLVQYSSSNNSLHLLQTSPQHRAGLLYQTNILWVANSGTSTPTYDWKFHFPQKTYRILASSFLKRERTYAL